MQPGVYHREFSHRPALLVQPSEIEVVLLLELLSCSHLCFIVSYLVLYRHAAFFLAKQALDLVTQKGT